MEEMAGQRKGQVNGGKKEMILTQVGELVREICGWTERE